MSPSRRLGPVATASALALGVAAAAVAGSGGLDPTFGVNGRVSLSPFVESYASSIAVQPDGKLVLAGTADDEAPPPPPPPAPEGLRLSNPDFLAVRLMPNGSFDQTFGAGGAVRTPVVAGAQPWEGARAVAVGADGSIVAAGFAATVTARISQSFATRRPERSIRGSRGTGSGLSTSGNRTARTEFLSNPTASSS